MTATHPRSPHARAHRSRPDSRPGPARPRDALRFALLAASLAIAPGAPAPAAALQDAGGAMAGGGADPTVPVPMFRGNPAHTGVFETRGVETLGGVAWELETGGPIRSTAALANGTLYVGSADGHLYAVSAEDGAPVWTFDAGAPVGSSPAVAGPLVIFADRAGVLRALDRSTGEPRWTLETGDDLPLAWGHEGWDYLAPSPVLASSGGRELALFAAGDGTVYAVEAGSGSIVWTHETARRFRGTPAVADGTAYIGGGDGVVYALDLDDGSVRWTHETAGTELDAADFGFDRTQIQSSPAVVDGVVYIGSRDASVYALDAGTGERLWTFEDGTAWVVNSAAVRGDMVLVGRSASGRFRRLDARTGEEEWVVATGALVFSSPALVGDVVYVANGAGWVFAFDVADGAERWRYRTGGGVYASPVVHDGRLYVGSDDGILRALEAGGAAPRLAVFWDDSLRAGSAWGAQDAHEQATEYFERHGYERLDGPGLVAFLEARIADGAPSAVVFGMDRAPDALTAGAPETTLLRRYLAADGKIVWMGFPPGLLVRDSTGTPTGIDRDVPGRLLDTDLSAWDTDVYGAFPTDEGRAWGLDGWFVGSPTADPEAVDVVLAVDELGRAAAWVRSFGGSPGRGFVYVPATTTSERLDAVRRVAEVGVMRTAPPSNR